MLRGADIFDAKDVVADGFYDDNPDCIIHNYTDEL